MNPLAISPAFTGEITIPQDALEQRDDILATAKTVQGVSSQEELETAVAVIRELSGLEKTTEAGRTKEKRPFLDFTRRIDDFAKTFIAPVSTEKQRITAFVDSYQRQEVARKQAEERQRQEAARKAAEEAAAAQRKIEEQQREIERQKLAAEQAKSAAAKKKAAEALAAAQAEQLKQRLAQEEANMAQQQASIVPAANTPVGLATRVSYDFEITDPAKLFMRRLALWTWKPGEEAWHFNRALLRKSLNSEVPNDYTGWLPPEGTESVVVSDYGIRVYVSVKINVRS